MLGLLLPLAVAAAEPGTVVVHVEGSRPLGKAARPGETVVLSRSGSARLGDTDPAGDVVFRGVSSGEWQGLAKPWAVAAGVLGATIGRLPAGEEAGFPLARRLRRWLE